MSDPTSPSTPGSPTEPTRGTDPSGRTAWRSLALWTLVLMLPVLAAAGLWQWQAHDRAELEQAQATDRAAVTAATRQTMAWATVDHREVDDYVASVKAGATGDFLDQFEASEEALRQLLADNKSVQVPTIPPGGVGLVERTEDQARVIIAMDATVTNASTKKPQPRQYRLQVNLRNEDGRWLTEGLEFIDGTA